MRNNIVFTDGVPPENDGAAVVVSCEIKRGDLKYKVHSHNGEYRLCDAGNYEITDVGFDTIDAVLDYINAGEIFGEKQNG